VLRGAAGANPLLSSSISQGRLQGQRYFLQERLIEFLFHPASNIIVEDRDEYPPGREQLLNRVTLREIALYFSISGIRNALLPGGNIPGI